LKYLKGQVSALFAVPFDGYQLFKNHISRLNKSQLWQEVITPGREDKESVWCGLSKLGKANTLAVKHPYP